MISLYFSFCLSFFFDFPVWDNLSLGSSEVLCIFRHSGELTLSFAVRIWSFLALVYSSGWCELGQRHRGISSGMWSFCLSFCFSVTLPKGGLFLSGESGCFLQFRYLEIQAHYSSWENTWETEQERNQAAITSIYPVCFLFVMFLGILQAILFPEINIWTKDIPQSLKIFSFWIYIVNSLCEGIF